MQYRSTRGPLDKNLNAPQAIIKGLADDGGLLVPTKFPSSSLPIENLPKMTYQQIVHLILTLFFNDFTPDQLQKSIEQAYGDQWDSQQITPISNSHSNNYYLELFHGPTLAFKDVALQILPYLMTSAVTIEQISNKIIILTATSGDTGTAAMRGFSNQSGTQVIVFYPHGGVSPVQLKQMLGQRGNNLTAIAIEGNFDDAQTEVKRIFNDTTFNQQLQQNSYQFSSANSMNIGRLIPQIAYYFSAYGQLVNKLGLPINKLICASDENNVLTDFFKTGEYNRQRQFYLTNSPAMDILVSSNLERLLFDLAGNNAELISKYMDQLVQEGHYQVNSVIKAQLDRQFAAGFATQDQVVQEIHRVYKADGYLIDPHTAVASFVTNQYQASHNDKTPTVIVSTASPYKFPETVYKAITGQVVSTPGLAAIHDLQKVVQQPLSNNVQDLFNQSIRAEQVIQPTKMEETISKLLTSTY